MYCSGPDRNFDETGVRKSKDREVSVWSRVWEIAAATTVLVGMQAASSAEVWMGSKVKWLYPQSDGQTLVLVFDVASSACNSTANPKYFYVTVGQNGVTSEGFKIIYAAAALAFATDKVLYIAFDDATQACYVNRVIVER